ncbi:MAG: peptidoglycan DD-metalloendopeptidase family protein [Halioglobus sp.]|nr:peptidoglycan DD-metalloendopeptidase family protein [Halioglobus sp.]
MLGCGNQPRAPVEDRTAQSQGGTYTVKRGDTLYSIAFRSGMDFRKVAVANGIYPPYTIYPGQIIKLSEAAPPGSVGGVGSVSQPRPQPQPSLPPPQAPVYSYGSSTAHAATPEPVVPALVPDTSTSSIPVAGGPAVYSPAPPEPVTPTVTPVPTPVPAPEPVRTPPEAVKPPPASTYTGEKVEVWLWPTGGAVTRGFSESVHKGIDIGGARGDPVVAVAAGKVVYAGTGIVGFGELLIIKHNEEYLSAYGHNNRLLVTEGQTITAGQIIAEKGSSGTDTVKLHFEIRKEGKPIDPQRVLPPR